MIIERSIVILKLHIKKKADGMLYFFLSKNVHDQKQVYAFINLNVHSALHDCSDILICHSRKSTKVTKLCSISEVSQFVMTEEPAAQM